MQVSALHVYPVKSCRGAALESAEVVERAIRHDRRFMVVRPDGALLTQRQEPRMALIEVAVDDDALTLDVAGQESCRIETRAVGPSRRVEVWGSPCEVVDQGDVVATWLSEYLGTPARLVAMSGGYRRPLREPLPREFDGRLSFADAAPLLVVGAASLDDLNRRLGEPVPMNRFRPNVVIAGAAPYAEDTWGRIRIGDIELVRLIPCGRCAVTTIDQATGAGGQEPLRTLASYRPQTAFGVPFGSYYGHVGTGPLRVGDAVEVVDPG